MADFAYRAIDSRGKRIRGESAAPDSETLTRKLEQRGLLVLDVENARALPSGSPFGLGVRRRGEVLEVTRALGSLLPAGLPLAQALGTAGNVASGRVTEALQSVREGVEAGESLAHALSQHPDLFSAVYLGLVRAGEKAGDLSGAFERLSLQLEREQELRARLLSASVYPILLAVMGGLAVLVLLLFVLPRFTMLLEGTGASLPRSTSMVLTAAALIRGYWPVFVALPLVAMGFLAWAAATDRGRRLATTAQLRIPLVAYFVRCSLAARFSRVCGTLLSGGSTLLSALDDTEQSLSDPVARDECVRIRASVREGSSLHQAMSEGSLFPALLPQLIAVGEESSSLPHFLLKAADIFEDKTERALQRLVTVLEPMMIVLLGGVVAAVALSLLQALYSINAGAFG